MDFSSFCGKCESLSETLFLCDSGTDSYIRGLELRSQNCFHVFSLLTGMGNSSKLCVVFGVYVQSKFDKLTHPNTVIFVHISDLA